MVKIRIQKKSGEILWRHITDPAKISRHESAREILRVAEISELGTVDMPETFWKGEKPVANRKIVEGYILLGDKPVAKVAVCCEGQRLADVDPISEWYRT